MLRRLVSRLRSLFRRRDMDAELREEIRNHLEEQISHHVANGMPVGEARRVALMTLGGVAQTEEQCRDARGLNLAEDFLQDVRYAFRQLRRSPGFSLLAILCLTSGIGANAAVYSWVEGILFRPYPAVANQERLLALAGTARGQTEATAISWPDLFDLQRSCTLLDAVIVTKITGATLSIGERAETATGSIVSANYFDALGIQPALGRGFEPGEDSGSRAHPVAVISYELWKGRFKGDPQIIGKTQRLNDVVHTIVGVAPEGFYGTFVGRAMHFWVPASMEETFESGGYKLEDREARWIEAYVRPKPGITRQQAQEQVSSVAARLETDYPNSNRGRGFELFPLWRTPFNHARTLLPTLEIMVAVVAFVLLIACANVANLLMVRSFARRHEMTVRLAIGAGRGRLLRQLLTEGLVLSALGTVGGLLVAYWCRHALVLLLPARGRVAMHLPGEIDWRVLVLSAAICLAATLVVGTVPAFHARKLELAGAFRVESTGIVGAGGKAGVRASLVMLQVGLSFILLVGAGLLVESLQKIRSTSPGFSTTRVLETAVPLIAAGYDESHAKTFQDQLIDRVNALPGVESAAFARVTPLGYETYSSTPIAVDGYEPGPQEQPAVDYNQVGPSYFATLGIPVVSGREFKRADDESAALVAVVNQTMVTRYWRGRDPVGQRLQVRGRWVQVVGVVADSKYESMRESARPFFYVPLRQDFPRGAALNIRTTQSPQAVAQEISREVRALDPNLGLYEMITLQEQVNRSTSPQFVAVTLVSVLGGLALVLASIGLYGVMAYTVSQSTRELGLRMALGAGASGVLRRVLLRGLLLTGGGVGLGFAVALVLTRWLRNLLYNVSPRDPRAFGLALAIMVATALAACVLPAWRAIRIDPARVLREG